jgi:hypothetical protein
MDKITSIVGNDGPGCLDPLEESKDQSPPRQDTVIDESAPFQAKERNKVRTVASVMLETQETQQKALPKGSKKNDTASIANRHESPARPGKPAASVTDIRATRSRTKQKLYVPGNESTTPSDQVVDSSPLSVQEDAMDPVASGAEKQTTGTMQREERQNSVDWPLPPKTKSPITCKRPEADFCSSLTESFVCHQDRKKLSLKTPTLPPRTAMMQGKAHDSGGGGSRPKQSVSTKKKASGHVEKTKVKVDY